MKLLSPKELVLVRLRIDRLNYIRHARGLTPTLEAEMRALVLRLKEHHKLLEEIRLGELLLASCTATHGTMGRVTSKHLANN